MDEEKQEFAKTVGRKRKQSEDLVAASQAADRLRQQQHQQRSMSTPVMGPVPESTEYGGLSSGHLTGLLPPPSSDTKERPSRRQRRGIETLGLEGVLEPSLQKPENDAASSGEFASS